MPDVAALSEQTDTLAVLFNDGNWPLGPGGSPPAGGNGGFDVVWLAADEALRRPRGGTMS